MGDSTSRGRGPTEDMGERVAFGVEGLGRPADVVTAVPRQPVRARDAGRVGEDAVSGGTGGQAGTAGHSRSTELEGAALGHVGSGSSRGAGATGVISGACGAPAQGSLIQRMFSQVLKASQLRVSLPDAQPVTVLRVERYLEDSTVPKPPASGTNPAPSYYYDVTVADNTCQEKCHLARELNPLVYKNILRCGLSVKITQCSYTYDEKKLHYGFVCIEQLEIVGPSDLGDSPQERKEFREKPVTPLRGGRRHYLPLWNNEDPYGDVWAEKKPPQDVCVDESKLTSVLNVENTWMSKISFRPLLVRIMQKARLWYRGKPGNKVDMPYQASFEVADRSGMTLMVMWDSLCSEWYHSMAVGTVLLLEQYTVKSRMFYHPKPQPTPDDLQLKRFSSMEITLNFPAKINIIPEKNVKAEWKLPEVKYQFVTRSELEALPNNTFCDIIGVVRYVGRTERTRKKDKRDFWVHRWVHVVDGTSEQPFILELFATSQPDVFVKLHPMAYLVCTQMRVVKVSPECVPCTVYLTTSNESQIFISGWHRGQPYTTDSKVKRFIQWVKTENEALHMEKSLIGGYYSFPPVPDTFSKYFESRKGAGELALDSVLTAIGEMRTGIESLHYREHKRIAIQGIISAVRYVSCSIAPRDATGVEPMQINRMPSLQGCASASIHVNQGRPTTESSSTESSPSSVQPEEHTVARKRLAKRKIETAETRNPSVPSERSYVTRSAHKKIMLQKPVLENSPTRKENQELRDSMEPCRTGNEETAEVPKRTQEETMCRNSWESALWTTVKDKLPQHLRYSRIFPESFPCKFDYAYKEFLMQQCNLQAAKCKPEECIASEKMSNFGKSSPVEYYEVTILGINHDIAVDVAFLPMCSAEDSRLFPPEGTLNNAGSPCTSRTSLQETLNKDRLSGIFSLTDEATKAAADLEKHVICVLDVCCLGEDKVEVFLNKVY